MVEKDERDSDLMQPLIKQRDKQEGGSDKESNNSLQFKDQPEDNGITPKKEGDFICSSKFINKSRFGIFGNHVSKGGD